MRGAAATLTSQLLFVELELATLAEEHYQEALKSPAFYVFQPWLRRLREGADSEGSPSRRARNFASSEWALSLEA